MKDFTSLPFLVFLLAASGGDSQEKESELICSDEPIVALAGEDVILPCHLEPPMGPGARKVLWSKPGLDNKFILVYQQGHMIREQQNPWYENRTALFEDQLQDGNVSLKLSSVKVSDAGRYLCTHEAAGKNTYIHLTVVAVSSVNINLVSVKSEEAKLECESNGWFPEPEVLFLDQDGNQIPAAPTETVQRPDGLYNVSRTVVVDDTTNFTCRVHLKDLNQTREAVIFVPADVLNGLITIMLTYAFCNSAFLLYVLIDILKDQKAQKSVSITTLKGFYVIFGIKTLNFFAVLTIFVVLIDSIHDFESELFFYSTLSCVTVVAIADLVSIVIILIKKYGVSFQRQLSFALIVINVILVGPLVLVHITAVLTSDNFWMEQIPSFWNVNTAVFVGAADLWMAFIFYKERTKLTALKRIFWTQKDKDVVKSEKVEFTAGQQVEEERGDEESGEDASAEEDDTEVRLA